MVWTGCPATGEAISGVKRQEVSGYVSFRVLKYPSGMVRRTLAAAKSLSLMRLQRRSFKRKRTASAGRQSTRLDSFGGAALQIDRCGSSLVAGGSLDSAAAMPPLAASTPLAYQEDNPKPEDSAAYARYHKYKGAQTFEAFLQSGGTLRDLRKDKKNGYVSVDADMDGAEALVKKLTAPKSLVPRWRAMKRIQNDLAAFDTGVDPGGEYVQPKPSFMDPIGDVPRRAPLFHSTRRRRPPPAELLRHRALVRTALSTVGFAGADKIAKAGNGGQKLCWPAMPLESTYRLRAPPTPAQVEAMRLRETEPLVMEPWRPAGAGLRAV